MTSPHPFVVIIQRDGRQYIGIARQLGQSGASASSLGRKIGERVVELARLSRTARVTARFTARVAARVN